MPSHIDPNSLTDLMERFMHENPYGDSRQLAEYMYNHGFEAGKKSNA